MKAFKEIQLLQQLLPPPCQGCQKTGVAAIQCQTIADVPPEVVESHLVKRMPCYGAGAKVGAGFEFSVPERRPRRGNGDSDEGHVDWLGIRIVSISELPDEGLRNWSEQVQGYFLD